MHRAYRVKYNTRLYILSYLMILSLFIVCLFTKSYTERDASNTEASWVLTNVADITTRGAFERIKEKMTKMSSQSHIVGKMKQNLEKGLEETERRSKISACRA